LSTNFIIILRERFIVERYEILVILDIDAVFYLPGRQTTKQFPGFLSTRFQAMVEPGAVYQKKKCGQARTFTGIYTLCGSIFSVG